MAEAIDNTADRAARPRIADIALAVALALLASANAAGQRGSADHAHANPRQTTVLTQGETASSVERAARDDQPALGPPAAPAGRSESGGSTTDALNKTEEDADLATSATRGAARPAPESPPSQRMRGGSDPRSLPLGGDRDGSRNSNQNNSAGSWLKHPIARTVAALSVVIGLIFLLWTVFRRTAGRVGGLAAQLGPGGQAPSGVLSVLARYPVARGQTLVLLQMDRRLLLLCQTTQGFQTLCEVTDPEEVASLITRAQDEEGRSLSKRFSNMLRGFERDPSIVGDVQADDDEARGPRSLRAVFDRASDADEPPRAEPPDQSDPVGSLRRRLHSMREASA